MFTNLKYFKLGIDEIEEIETELKAKRPVMDLDGYRAYTLNEIVNILEIKYKNDPSIKSAIDKVKSGNNDGTLGAHAVYPVSNRTKPYILISNSLFKSDLDYEVACWHEYGHIQHGHGVINLAITLEKELFNTKNKLFSKPRLPRNEILCDIVSVQHTSLERAIKFIEQLILRTKSQNKELQLRLDYLKLWKNTDTQPDIDEFLKNKKKIN